MALDRHHPDQHDSELILHLTQVFGLNAQRAEHLVAEVLSFYSETCLSFVQRRHQELQHSGLTNSVIYTQILEEINLRRFPATVLSERKIRRMIYG